MALTKSQKRKRKLQARKTKEANQNRQWENKFNKERTIARNKIREDYRKRGISEDRINELLPPNQDRCF
jgi:hypothetical protein